MKKINSAVFDTGPFIHLNEIDSSLFITKDLIEWTINQIEEYK